MKKKKPYFPFFVDIHGARGIIVGGGKHAYQKIVKMLPYGADLTVIAPEFLTEIEELEQTEAIHLIRREFIETDLYPRPDFAVVASGVESHKMIISKFCKERRIPVNVVDDVKYSSYIYPTLISKGDLSIGISTGGASPTVAIKLKKEIEELIPDRMEQILNWLSELRPMVKESVTEEKTRAKVFRIITEKCMSRNEILTNEEVEMIIKEAAGF